MNHKLGEGQLRKLAIRSTTKPLEVNIANIGHSFSIYEDVFAQHMSGNVELIDGTNLQNTLPVVGGESVAVDFGLYGDDKNLRRFKKDFVVFSMANRERIGPDIESYVLGLTTPENLLDAVTDVRRSYEKPIHEVVRDVVTEFLTPITGKRLVTVEETKGILHIVVPGITVNAFIHYLCREAESIEHPTSVFQFYETQEGYHFETLDGMYERAAIETFAYDDVIHNNMDIRHSNKLHNIITNINFNNSFNLMHGQINGQFNIETESFDPLTKTHRHTSRYQYPQSFVEGPPQASARNRNPTISNSVYNRYFNAPTTSNYLATDSHRSSVDYIVKNESRVQNVHRRRQDFLAKEKAALQQYGTQRIQISIPGNPNVIAGRCINVIIPKADDTEMGRKQNDRYMSGKYLVTAVAHNLSVPNGKYATVIECMRNSYQERIQ